MPFHYQVFGENTLGKVWGLFLLGKSFLYICLFFVIIIFSIHSFNSVGKGRITLSYFLKIFYTIPGRSGLGIPFRVTASCPSQLTNLTKHVAGMEGHFQYSPLWKASIWGTYSCYSCVGLPDLQAPAEVSRNCYSSFGVQADNAGCSGIIEGGAQGQSPQVKNRVHKIHSPLYPQLPPYQLIDGACTAWSIHL